LGCAGEEGAVGGASAALFAHFPFFVGPSDGGAASGARAFKPSTPGSSFSAARLNRFAAHSGCGGGRGLLAASIDAPCLAAKPSTPGSWTSRLALPPFVDLAVSSRSCTFFLPVKSNLSKMLGFGGLYDQRYKANNETNQNRLVKAHSG